MRISSRKRLAGLGLIVVLVLAALACERGGREGDSAPFRIGVMESLTGAGETYGTVALQAKKMALDEINAAGGVNGRLLEFAVEDSKTRSAALRTPSPPTRSSPTWTG